MNGVNNLQYAYYNGDLSVFVLILYTIRRCKLTLITIETAANLKCTIRQIKRIQNETGKEII